MDSLDHVGITFVNTVIGAGVLNGVVNMQLGAFAFEATGDKVEAAPKVAARLRMDVLCARRMRDELDRILGAIAVAEAHAQAPAQTPEPDASAQGMSETVN